MRSNVDLSPERVALRSNEDLSPERVVLLSNVGLEGTHSRAKLHVRGKATHWGAKLHVRGKATHWGAKLPSRRTVLFGTWPILGFTQHPMPTDRHSAQVQTGFRTTTRARTRIRHLVQPCPRTSFSRERGPSSRTGSFALERGPFPREGSFALECRPRRYPLGSKATRSGQNHTLGSKATLSAHSPIRSLRHSTTHPTSGCTLNRPHRRRPPKKPVRFTSLVADSAGCPPPLPSPQTGPTPSS